MTVSLSREGLVELEWMLVCENFDPSGPTIMGAGMDGTQAPSSEPPWGLPLTLAICLACEYHELLSSPTATIRVRVLDPDLRSIFDTAQPIQLAVAPQHYEGWRGRVILGTRFRAEIVSAGDYTIEARINDQSPKTLGYRVFAPGSLTL